MRSLIVSGRHSLSPYDLTALSQAVTIRQRAVAAEQAAMSIHSGPVIFQLDQEAQALASIQTAITMAEEADALGAAALEALAVGRTAMWNQAMQVLGQLTAASPQGSPYAFWDHMVGMIGQALGWIVNPLNPLSLFGSGGGGINPAAGLKSIRDLGLTGLGVLGMLGGAVGEGGGLALDATGVGAVAGVPVNVASAGLFVTGAATATAGAALLGNDLRMVMAQGNGGGGNASNTGSPSASGNTASTIEKEVADEVSNKLGGQVNKIPNDINSWKVEVPNGKRPIIVRIMEAGSGNRSLPYFRVSVAERSALNLQGEFSSDRALTHFDITDRAVAIRQILDIVQKFLGR